MWCSLIFTTLFLFHIELRFVSALAELVLDSQPLTAHFSLQFELTHLLKDRDDGPSGCVDKIPTCHHFMVDYDACSSTSAYYQYIEPNCRATCGLCNYNQGNQVTR